MVICGSYVFGVSVSKDVENHKQHRQMEDSNIFSSDSYDIDCQGIEDLC